MVRKIFTYDDVILPPRYSELDTRDDGDTSVSFLNCGFKLPVIPANMRDVISVDVAKKLADKDYCYIMHRFDGQDGVDELDGHGYGMSISLGVNETDKEYIRELVLTPQFITIDVAHAHHKKVADMLKFLHWLYQAEDYLERPKFIVGNIATGDAYKFLCDHGADAAKVGIGGGSICTTKYQTGFHIPTATSVHECHQVAMEGHYDIPIIADGGARHFGDIAKALVLGADMVMAGSWFASCIDSPAQIVHGKKVYRGSTSYEATKRNRHIEGRTLELDEGTTYMERMEEIRQALCSSISYAGGKDLRCFNHVQWELL